MLLTAASRDPSAARAQPVLVVAKEAHHEPPGSRARLRRWCARRCCRWACTGGPCRGWWSRSANGAYRSGHSGAVGGGVDGVTAAASVGLGGQVRPRAAGVDRRLDAVLRTAERHPASAADAELIRGAADQARVAVQVAAVQIAALALALLRASRQQSQTRHGEETEEAHGSRYVTRRAAARGPVVRAGYLAGRPLGCPMRRAPKPSACGSGAGQVGAKGWQDARGGLRAHVPWRRRRPRTTTRTGRR